MEYRTGLSFKGIAFWYGLKLKANIKEFYLFIKAVKVLLRCNDYSWQPIRFIWRRTLV
jgi:hypothetical protein